MQITSSQKGSCRVNLTAQQKLTRKWCVITLSYELAFIKLTVDELVSANNLRK